MEAQGPHGSLLQLWSVAPRFVYKLPSSKGLDIRIPIIIPIKGRGLLINGLHHTACSFFSRLTGFCRCMHCSLTTSSLNTHQLQPRTFIGVV